VKPLIKALRDPEPPVGGEAAAALMSIGSAAKAAVPALQKAAKDSDPQVRKRVAEALSLIEPEGGSKDER
jgi:HEAT repeat protein